MQQWGPPGSPACGQLTGSHLLSSGSKVGRADPFPLARLAAGLRTAPFFAAEGRQKTVIVSVPSPPGDRVERSGKKAYIIFRFPIPVRLIGLIHLTVLEFSTCSLSSTLLLQAFPLAFFSAPFCCFAVSPVTVSSFLLPVLLSDLDETVRTFSPQQSTTTTTT